MSNLSNGILINVIEPTICPCPMSNLRNVHVAACYNCVGPVMSLRAPCCMLNLKMAVSRCRY